MDELQIIIAIILYNFNRYINLLKIWILLLSVKLASFKYIMLTYNLSIGHFKLAKDFLEEHQRRRIVIGE